MRTLAILLVTTACGTSSPPTVRLCNDTGYDINAVAWSGIYTSDSLGSGACTSYETPTSKVYRYTDVRFRVQTDSFEITPIDYVGEIPLGEGAWSYHLTITDYATRSANVAATKDP